MNHLQNISTEDVKRYQEELSKSASPATLKRKQISLNRFFNWAEKNGQIEKNPLDQTIITTKPKKKFGYKIMATLSLTTALVILLFLLARKLQFPIPFITTPAQESIPESKIQTTINNNQPAGSPSAIPANSAVISSYNLFTKLQFASSTGGPITRAQTIVFKLYKGVTDSSPAWTSDPQAITPDTNGSSLVSLAGVPTDLFWNNNTLYLDAEIGGSSSLSKRIPVSTASTPANLSGYLAGNPETGASPETVPVISSDGSLLLASQSPAIKGTSGNLLVEGQAVTIKAADGSGGNIEINPDANGFAHFLFEGSSGNFLNAQAPNLTNGSLYYGMVPNNSTEYYLLKLQSGSPKMTTRFSVDAVGNTNQTGSLSTLGVVRLTAGGALQNITGYSQSSGNFTVTQNPGDFASITKDITSGGALSDVLTLTLDERGKPAVSNSDYSTLVLRRYDGSINSYALFVDEGNARFDGQLQLGRFSSNPSSTGQGSLVFNTTDNKVYVWDGTQWISVGTNFWQRNSGVLSPATITDNLAIGGTSSSAPFYVAAATGNTTIAGTTKLNGVTYTWPSADGSSGYALTTNGSGTLSWSPASGLGTNYWSLTNGALYPQNSTVDLLVGGTATNSAKFAFMNVNSGTPTASISGTIANVATFIDGNGNISSTNRNNLILGNSSTYDSTGNILLNPLNPSGTRNVGIGTTNPQTPLYISSAGTTIATFYGPVGNQIANNIGYTNASGRSLFYGFADNADGVSGYGFLAVYGDALGGSLNVKKGGNVGIGTTGPDRKLDVLAAAAPQLRLTQTDGTVYSDFQLDSNGYLLISPTGSRTALGGSLQVGSATSPLAYSRFGTATTANGLSVPEDVLVSGKLELNGTLFLNNGNIANSIGTSTIHFCITAACSSTSMIENTLTAGSWLIQNPTSGNVGQAALMVDQRMPNRDIFTASASGTPKFIIDYQGQTQIGNIASNPTPLGAGSIYFNTTTNTFKCYNGSTWSDCAGTLYSNTNASVADGSFITVAHNQNTSDLLTSTWINSESKWKLLNATYQPAIAWEGKDTEKGVYHNNINSYVPTQEATDTTTNLAAGLLFDTFEDTTKTDSANTTSSITNQKRDDGASNYTTLQSRIQSGRVGLAGGQTYSTLTTDNAGNTYLGSNTVNKVFYYDRSKDSIPQVLVELGIDPNWYNGVTLSVATTSAQLSQSSTIPYSKNPNLTTSYNGSLIKATGNYTSNAKTIYITIKDPTHFDWTDYNGNAATNVAMTQGTAQTLTGTGVSVTFTNANYNTGDVFRIASWYVEALGTSGATRGDKAQFPERSYIIATSAGVDIIDADTQKLWMRFSLSALQTNMLGATSATSILSVSMLNGHLSAGNNGTSGRILATIVFDTDSAYSYGSATSGYYPGNIAQRNAGLGYSGASLTNTPILVSSNNINDIATAVIPNRPTQTMTVSGWGYIVGDGVNSAPQETVNLPYRFTTVPNITIAESGSRTSAPSSLSDCTGAPTVFASAFAITGSSFGAALQHRDATALTNGTSYCYTWTATGTVSPKQFVAAAEGNSTSGGSDIINETDGTVAHIFSAAGVATASVWQTKVAIAGNEAYFANQNIASNITNLKVYYGIHGLTTEATNQANARTTYNVFSASPTPYPQILGTATGTLQITSLAVTPGTSTIDGKSNTLYIGTTSGLTVLQENQSLGNIADGSEENSGSVKYYTKDYISEEMVGDIRGMWPGPVSSSSFLASVNFGDASVKGLTITNKAAFGSVSGVRGFAFPFDGSSMYLCSGTLGTCADSGDVNGASAMSVGAWVKPTSSAPASPGGFLFKYDGTNFGYFLRQTTGALTVDFDHGGDSSFLTSSGSMLVNQWNYVVGTWNGSTESIYINGQLAGTRSTTAAIVNSTSSLCIGAWCNGTPGTVSQFFAGTMDEHFITATALSAAQVKHMYEVGYRALQSHGTTLGGGSADVNQRLGGTTNTLGDARPDYNNQFMYAGTNDVTNGRVSKIDLNSDTNIKTYDKTTNTPTGGPLLANDDTDTLAVGHTLEAVGSAASGVKSMGVDNNATATSGSFVSKTYTLPKSIASAVIWASPILDSSDVSNTLTVKASVDGGSTYATCTALGTDTFPAVPEKEYACTFATSGTSLKVKFDFVRGSTKTNTYVTQYGITWLGQTGFRVEQADVNNVRLYNYSGEAQNLKLNVTGAGFTNLANPWTDAGSYLYPTGFETVRVYDGGGVNYFEIAPSGTDVNFKLTGTTKLTMNSTGDLLPGTDNTQSLGSTALRWKTLHVGPGSVVVHNDATNTLKETLGFSGSTAQLVTDAATPLQLTTGANTGINIDTAGKVGIGKTTPLASLDISGDFWFGPGSSSVTQQRLTSDGSGSNMRLQSPGAVFIQAGGGSLPKVQIGGTAPAEAGTNFYINNVGNVGIGTTSPSSVLQVNVPDTTNNEITTSMGGQTPFLVSNYGNVQLFPVGFDKVFSCVGASCTSADSGTFTDNTTESKTSAGTAYAMVGTGTTATFYTAFNIPFNVIVFNTAVASSGLTLAVEYWNGSAWTAVSGLNDGTTNLTALGNNNLSFTMPSNWAKNTVNGTNDYYIRMRSTTSVATAPTAFLTQITGYPLIIRSGQGDAGYSFAVYQSGNVQVGISNQYTQILCHSGSNGSTQQFVILGDCTTNPDLAEEYGSDGTISAGDIVMPDPMHPSVEVTGGNGKPTTKSWVVKANPAFPQNAIGIISTNPTGMILGEGLFENSENPVPVALSGRLPVKVTSENGPIKVGDSLTLSSQSGVAAKATKAGPIIAKALQAYDNPDPTTIGKIDSFVNISWFDPQLQIADLSGLSIDKNPDTGDYRITKADQMSGTTQVINTIGTFANLVVANIKSGFIRTQELVAENITSNIVKTKLISPLADGTDITIQIGNKSNTGSTGGEGKLAIQNAEGTEVANIDSQGNATFEGVVRAKNIDEITALLNQVAADQNVLLAATASTSLTASSSASLANLAVTDLYVTNQGAFNSLSVTNNLAIGTDFVISQALGTSLNTLAGPLKLQSLALAPVEIMAGLVTIDTHGNVNIAGDLNVAGKIKAGSYELSAIGSEGNPLAAIDASGSAQFNSISTPQLVVAAPDATASGTIINGVITTNSTIGQAAIPAGISEVTIKNPKVTDYTLVYVTPTSPTDNYVLYVKSKQAGQFVVGFTNPLAIDVNFNWWIVGVAN